MAITTDNETRQTRMTVTVRVPNGTDGDLLTNAERRLCRAEGVSTVTVDELRSLQPGLSATEVTVHISVEADGTQNVRSVADSFETLADVEIVAR